MYIKKYVNNKSIAFSNVTVELLTNHRVLVFQLTKPMSEVVGSLRVISHSDASYDYIKAVNVTQIKCLEEDYPHWAKIDRRGSGRLYTSNFIMDVSKRGDVWLTKESFAERERLYRNERRVITATKLIKSVLNQ